MDDDPEVDNEKISLFSTMRDPARGREREREITCGAERKRREYGKWTMSTDLSATYRMGLLQITQQRMSVRTLSFQRAPFPFEVGGGGWRALPISDCMSRSGSVFRVLKSQPMRNVRRSMTSLGRCAI